MGDALRRQGKGQLKLNLKSDGIVQTEDCMGDALRGQGEGKSQLKLALHSDGMLVDTGRPAIDRCPEPRAAADLVREECSF